MVLDSYTSTSQPGGGINIIVFLRSRIPNLSDSVTNPDPWNCSSVLRQPGNALEAAYLANFGCPKTSEKGQVFSYKMFSRFGPRLLSSIPPSTIAEYSSVLNVLR